MIVWQLSQYLWRVWMVFAQLSICTHLKQKQISLLSPISLQNNPQIFMLLSSRRSSQPDNRVFSYPNSPQKLWRDGQTTTKFVCPTLPIARAQRFKLYSIYWPPKNELQHPHTKPGELPIHAEARRISKLIDQEEKSGYRNMALAKLFSNRVKVSSPLNSPKRKTASRQPSVKAKCPPKNPRRVSTPSDIVVDRLYIREPKGRISPKRDRHGFLTCEILPLVEENAAENNNNYDVNSDSKTRTMNELAETGMNEMLMSDSKGFSRARRLDLGRPHNFYPGPGTYTIERFLDRTGSKPRSLSTMRKTSSAGTQQ